jgi:hypothetical protein
VRSACKRDPQRMSAAGCRLDAEDERKRGLEKARLGRVALGAVKTVTEPDSRLESSTRIISAHGFARLKLRAEEQSMSGPHPQRLRIR